MTDSTFDVVTNKTWVSRGSVTFPNLDIDLNTTPAALKLGYYPCAGMTFTPTPLKPLELDEKEVYWWDEATGKPRSFKRTPKPVRRVKFTIANPDEAHLVSIRQEINGKLGKFAPQALVNAEFIRKFSGLVFYERAHDLLISDKLIITGLQFVDREGKPHSTTNDSYSVVFYMTHIANPAKGGEVTMMTEAVWNDGYVSMYGCC